MTKAAGFKIRIDAFIALDKKDFAKQAAAFALIADIQKANTLSADFFTTATILSVDARQGSAEIPDAPKADDGGKIDGGAGDLGSVDSAGAHTQDKENLADFVADQQPAEAAPSADVTEPATVTGKKARAA